MERSINMVVLVGLLCQSLRILKLEKEERNRTFSNLPALQSLCLWEQLVIESLSHPGWIWRVESRQTWGPWGFPWTVFRWRSPMRRRKACGWIWKAPIWWCLGSTPGERHQRRGAPAWGWRPAFARVTKIGMFAGWVVGDPDHVVNSSYSECELLLRIGATLIMPMIWWCWLNAKQEKHSEECSLIHSNQSR